MQQKSLCCFDGQRILGKTITAYHAWWIGEDRVSYKQKMCFKHAQSEFGDLMLMAVDAESEHEEMPTQCPSCGAQFADDGDWTWTTWYRGQNRKDTILVLCQHCAGNRRQIMLQRAERQPDRQVAGVGAGGAPLPNPPGFGSKEDLPW